MGVLCASHCSFFYGAQVVVPKFGFWAGGVSHKLYLTRERFSLVQKGLFLIFHYLCPRTQLPPPSIGDPFSETGHKENVGLNSLNSLSMGHKWGKINVSWKTLISPWHSERRRRILKLSYLACAP